MSFYVRNVKLPDQTVSFTVALNAEGAWEIKDVVSEDENIIPVDVILDFATIEVKNGTNLEIDWIIYKGSILSGVLGLSDEDITVSTMFTNRGTVEEAEDFPKAFGDLLAGRESDTSDAELASLRKEYEEKISTLSAEGDSLQVQIDKLKKDKAALEALSTKLEADNSSLQDMIDTLKAAGDSTVSASGALVQSYIDKLDSLKTEITALRSTFSSLEGMLQSEMLTAAATVSESLSDDFDWAMMTLSGEVEKVADSITDSLSADLEAAKTDIIESISTTDGLGFGETAQIASLKAQIEDLKVKNKALSDKLGSLGDEIRASFMKDGFIEFIRPSLTLKLLSSFEPSDAQLGLWHVGAKSASQLEKSMLFGKLLLPVTQEETPVLYSFKARSTDPYDEWVGLGLHIFVDGVEKRGYGLGDSLLVWLTRDQEVYKNDYTYLQLYRSDDDVHMDRVMDAVIQEPITEFIEIEVLYQPVLQYITISVDGEEKIRYKTWFGIEEGVQVALRSLGTAEFADLLVTTTP
jgi:hypothetical protein